MSVTLKSTEASEAFRSLITTYKLVEGILADEMMASSGISLERYAILMMLAQAEGGVIRPSELAEGLPLTRSGTTRLVDRLESDGLVERRSCETDRRGNLLALTEEGEKLFVQAGRVHLRGIDQHIGSHLTRDDMRELRRILAKLAAGVDDGK